MRTDVIYNGDCIQGLKRLPDNLLFGVIALVFALIIRDLEKQIKEMKPCAKMKF